MAGDGTAAGGHAEMGTHTELPRFVVAHRHAVQGANDGASRGEGVGETREVPNFAGCQLPWKVFRAARACETFH